MRKMRSAVVVGATGLVGSELVKILCASDDYQVVKVIARRPLEDEHPKLEVVVKQLHQVADEDLNGIQDVFCCLGTTRKKAGSNTAFKQVDLDYPLLIAQKARASQVEQFVVISAMGADERSFFYYSQIKGRLENELIRLSFPALSILRPGLLTGKRKEYRLFESMGAAIFKILDPLFVGPLQNFRSIPARQVALAMKNIALTADKNTVNVYYTKEIRRFGKLD